MSGGINPVPNTPIADKMGRLTVIWEGFFSSVQNFLGPIGQSGASTSRPLNSTSKPLYIGQPYWDTTLGKPIWVKSLNPTVWVDATSTPV